MRFRYQDLAVGELIADFIDSVYDVTKSFPDVEKFELARQMRRAATSAYLNLAEGTGKKSKKDFARFITTSQGSLIEVHACAYLAKRRGYITEEQFQRLDESGQRIWIMLSALHDSQVRENP